jgi:predicted DNA-binding antitoxin AbrB/MazE fold protein
MTQVTEAIYRNGVLETIEALDFREGQRVRVLVEPLADQQQDRAMALARLTAGIDSMQFFSNGRLPDRADLHDRR